MTIKEAIKKARTAEMYDLTEKLEGFLLENLGKEEEKYYHEAVSRLQKVQTLTGETDSVVSVINELYSEMRKDLECYFHDMESMDLAKLPHLESIELNRASFRRRFKKSILTKIEELVYACEKTMVLHMIDDTSIGGEGFQSISINGVETILTSEQYDCFDFNYDCFEYSETRKVNESGSCTIVEKTIRFEGEKTTRLYLVSETNEFPRIFHKCVLDESIAKQLEPAVPEKEVRTASKIKPSISILPTEIEDVDLELSTEAQPTSGNKKHTNKKLKPVNPQDLEDEELLNL